MPNVEDRPAAEGPRAVGLVYHPDYLDHRMPPGHPERPERLRAIMEHLEGVGLLERLVRIEPRLADEAWIAEVHAPDYIATVAEICCKGGGLLDWGDTPVCPESYEVARLAVGGVLAAVDAAMEGRVGSALCLVRPPGHHARPGNGMGFCVFNNVAVAARYVQKHHGLRRVLIADWDVHHGNGTQEAFYGDPSVLYFSTHRYPFYPGTGAASETGVGEGKGTTLNVPMQAGSGRAEFLAAFQDQLLPAAEAFRPDFVLASVGFDTHGDDPLGGMRLADEDFGALAAVVAEIAETHCDGRLVASLEGGYALEAEARGVAEVLRAFLRGNTSAK